MRNYGSKLILCIIVVSLIMSGCTKTADKDLTQAPKQTSGFYIKDCFDREVFIPDEVKNIAALYSFAGYAVSVLGRGADLVAVPGGLQRDVVLVDMIPEIAKASVPRSSGKINIEELLKLEPDVVIVRGDTAQDEKETEQLDRAGINYIVVDYKDLKEQQRAISVIGEAIGRKEKAVAFNDYYNDVIEKVKNVVEGIPKDERIRMYHSENQVLRTIYNDSLPADWSRTAGVINVSVGEELNFTNDNYFASLEQVLLWDPDVIIANEDSAARYILGNPQWSGIKAVQEGRVYKLPQGVSRWGHPGSVETPLALLWLAKTVYPDRFEDIDMEAEVEYFYRQFFGYELSREMAEQILEGEGLRKPKGE